MPRRREQLLQASQPGDSEIEQVPDFKRRLGARLHRPLKPQATTRGEQARERALTQGAGVRRGLHSYALSQMDQAGGGQGRQLGRRVRPATRDTRRGLRGKALPRVPPHGPGNGPDEEARPAGAGGGGGGKSGKEARQRRAQLGGGAGPEARGRGTLRGRARVGGAGARAAGRGRRGLWVASARGRGGPRCGLCVCVCVCGGERACVRARRPAATCGRPGGGPSGPSPEGGAARRGRPFPLPPAGSWRARYGPGGARAAEGRGRRVPRCSRPGRAAPQTAARSGPGRRFRGRR